MKKEKGQKVTIYTDIAHGGESMKLNPDRKEFLDKDGNEKLDPTRKFEYTPLPHHNLESMLKKAQVDRVVRGMGGENLDSFDEMDTEERDEFDDIVGEAEDDLPLGIELTDEERQAAIEFLEARRKKNEVNESREKSEPISERLEKGEEGTSGDTKSVPKEDGGVPVGVSTNG